MIDTLATYRSKNGTGCRWTTDDLMGTFAAQVLQGFTEEAGRLCCRLTLSRNGAGCQEDGREESSGQQRTADLAALHDARQLVKVLQPDPKKL